MLSFDKGSEDYGNILAVSRNNESTIYTSQYINYLRTGLQYDLKMKQAQEEYKNIVKDKPVFVEITAFCKNKIVNISFC